MNVKRMKLNNKVVFFDIGYTLVQDPAKGPAQRIAQALDLAQKYIPALEKIIFLENLDDAKMLYDRLKNEFGIQTKAKFKHLQDLWNLQLQEASEVNGATRAVSEFRQAGFSVGLISNIWKPYFQSFQVACPKLLSQVDAFFLSFELGIRKPDHSIFERALKFFAVQPDNAVMVGNNYDNDIKPAISLGMKAIWILSKPSNELGSIIRVLNNKNPMPDFTVKSINCINSKIINFLF